MTLASHFHMTLTFHHDLWPYILHVNSWEYYSLNIWILAVSPRHACGWNKKSIHEIVAPYITPSIQDFHHSSYRSTYQKSLITKIDFINAMRWTWLEGGSPSLSRRFKMAVICRPFWSIAWRLIFRKINRHAMLQMAVIMS